MLNNGCVFRYMHVHVCLQLHALVCVSGVFIISLYILPIFRNIHFRFFKLFPRLLIKDQ